MSIYNLYIFLSFIAEISWHISVKPGMNGCKTFEHMYISFIRLQWTRNSFTEIGQLQKKWYVWSHRLSPKPTPFIIGIFYMIRWGQRVSPKRVCPSSTSHGITIEEDSSQNNRRDNLKSDTSRFRTSYLTGYHFDSRILPNTHALTEPVVLKQVSTTSPSLKSFLSLRWPSSRQTQR